MWGRVPFAIIAAHSLNPNSSPIKKQKSLVYNSPLKQWKALLVRNEDPNKSKEINRDRAAAHAGFSLPPKSQFFLIQTVHQDLAR